MQEQTVFPENLTFGSNYQNRNLVPVEKVLPKPFLQQRLSSGAPATEIQRFDTVQPEFSENNRNMKILESPQKVVPINSATTRKQSEVNLLKNEVQSQVRTRSEKLKALHKSGPRAFSGPVEKVLKWHKSLQDIGLLVFYEIVAKCVSVRPGERCAKNIVVRDDNGPAMQVVYYEVDFLLPELTLPCTVRVIGRMMPGTCRLQAFQVRLATGDDVATLPRRAAVAAHHVAKLSKEYGKDNEKIVMRIS
ncbi:spermatogenesis-associated protein 22 [Epargyreus clarus]|uniref:spermatogenesis-associated protein 22 n=1 Tax=Epargyreus clarus TaxID=520877 RepID=UPI003C2D162E